MPELEELVEELSDGTYRMNRGNDLEDMVECLDCGTELEYSHEPRSENDIEVKLMEYGATPRPHRIKECDCGTEYLQNMN